MKDAKGNVIIEANTVISKDVIEVINENKIDEVNLRSILTCETEG